MTLPGDDEDYDNGAQLNLAREDDALPWLESDDDYEEEGSDYRIVIFALLAVAALAAILFAVNYFLSDRAVTSDVVADGSTIEAPDEPYKTRPDDPGGSEVAGTGDVSFEVGQGQVREGRLADDTPAPSIDIDQADAAPGAGASTRGVGVQVGAFQTRASAQSAWVTLRGRFPALQSFDYRIVEGTADSGTIFRLQAVAADMTSAESLCRSIRSGGGDCQVKP